MSDGSPPLPAGLSIANNCQITGTPTALAVATDHSVTATNPGGSDVAVLNITVKDKPPTLSYSGSPYTFSNTVEITPLTPTNSGGAIVSCSSNPMLPGGLSLSNVCVISGTPNVKKAVADYVITATNTGGDATATIRITVNETAPNIEYAGSPFTYNKAIAISALTPTNTGGPITSCASVPTLPAGLTLSVGCVLSGTPTTVAELDTYTITATNEGGSDTYDIDIEVKDTPPSITYSGSPFQFTKDVAITTVSPTNTGGTITSCGIAPNLNTATGLTFSTTDCQISGTPTTLSVATEYTITATNDGGDSIATINVTVKDAAPAISYAGSPYSFTKDVAITTVTPANTGGDIVTCSSSPALPAGLSIEDTTCAISGTPTAITDGASYTITATNTGGSSVVAIIIAIKDAVPAISYSPSTYVYTKDSAITDATPTNTGGTIISCASSPTLPAGLALSATCVLSGTPTEVAAAANYTITATNTGGTSSVTLNITVKDLAPVISYAGSPFTYTRNSAITDLEPTNTGGTITSCSSSPALPAGLSISSVCVIAGTPTTITAAADYTITATNSGGSASTSINITVNAVAPVISYAGSPFTYTKDSAITDLTPTNTGGTVTSCSSSPALPTGLSLSATCVLSGTPTVVAAAADYIITGTNTGGSSAPTINITVNAVAPNITYTGSPFTYHKNSAITALTVNNTGGTIVTCGIDPALPDGLSINTTTCTISGTPTEIDAVGTDYTITAENSGGQDTTGIHIVVTDAAPAISYTGSPFTYTLDEAVSLSATNTGGAITDCSVDKVLPSGLGINATTCAITGTPDTITAIDTYTITATNDGGSSEAAISITVNDEAPSIDYLPTSYNFTYTKDAAIDALTPNNGGGTITSCTSSPALPTGLSLNQANCQMTGTPTVVLAAQEYTITATNTGGSSEAVITITINDEVPVISYAGSPFTYEKNVAIADLEVTNTGGTITSCSSSPALPGGLSLSSTCKISGTPTQAVGATDYTITATNSGGTDSAAINITVTDVAPSITFDPANKTFTLRTAISAFSPTNTGGTATSCSSSPTLPTGLSISSTCQISGTPTVTIVSTSYTITATNSGGNANTSLTITVKNLPQILFYGYNALNGNFNGSAPSSLNIWKISSDGVDRSALTSNSALSLDSKYPVFAPGGTSVAFSSLRDLSGPTTASSYNIWKMASGGSSQTELTSNSNASLDSESVPQYSPNGTKIVFASKSAVDGSNNGTAASSYNIFIMNADGTGRTALTANTIAGLDSYTPVFGPSGTVIYFSSKNDLTGSNNGSATDSFNIWKINTDGSGKTVLTTESVAGKDSIDPMVSSDGNTVIYASKADVGVASSSYNIWKMASDGAGKTALTTNTAASLDSQKPHFSSDDAEIIFTSLMDVNAAPTSSYNVWKMNTDGSSQVALTTNNAANLDSDSPVFVAGDTRIVFSSRQDIGATAVSSYNIWIMTDSGTSQTALTQNTNTGLDSYLSPHSVYYAE